jgi:tyrosine-protein kinase Etk/Wzc
MAYSVLRTAREVPLYRSQAMLRFAPPATQMSEMNVFAMGPMVQTELDLLLSEDMAMRVAKKRNWDVDRARRSYKAEKMGQSPLILIHAVDPSPKEAADIANLVMDTFIEWDMESRTTQSRKALEDAEARRKSVEDELHKLEEKRKNFLEEHETASVGSTLAMNLLDLESRRRELLHRYTPEHPEVVKLDQRIAVIRRGVAQFPAEAQELEEITRDLKVQEEAYVALSKQIETTKVAVNSTLSFFNVISRAAPPSSPYSPNKRLNYMIGFFAAFALGIFAAFVLEDLDISITTIEDIEKILRSPVLGIIPHLGSESRWQDFRTRFLSKRRHPEHVFRSLLIFRKEPKSPQIEAYHNLRVNIQSQLGKPKSMVLTFTSSGVAEGKTLTAANFCMASAHSGLKTLLIGADVRRPSLHRIFGLPKQPGLIEALSGTANWRDTIRNTVDILIGEEDVHKLTAFPGIDNFKIMTGWSKSTAEVVNLFSSERLAALIAELRQAFDVVVFDCPPVLLFVDAMLIGEHTDGVVLVYKSGKMARRALKRAKDQVTVSHGKILGVVFNDVHATDMDPGYGAYSDYGHYVNANH